ncbi:YraN family protein [Nafulsella turpanensis]|uniref:YraN family protein n=1 Tax=Nafulsella turpanensis TaxID=1265690 RepID=UPI0003465B14|nr:YraN family protein [Nafulsella turpanensis]
MDDKQATGKLGEKLAAEYLQQKGYEIIASNYRHRRGEIDLIAQHEGVLIFVEVKTRKGGPAWGYPEEAVDAKKARLIVATANAYIFETDWHGEIRFDIVSVQLGITTLISHFEDAFY